MLKRTITQEQFDYMMLQREQKINVAVLCALIARPDNYEQIYDDMLYGENVQERKVVAKELDDVLKKSVIRLMMMRNEKTITEEEFIACIDVIKTDVVNDNYKKNARAKYHIVM